jgi:hypothetical protein
MTARTEEPQVCEVVHLIAELSFKLGEYPLTRYPEGWICRVDDNWTVAGNGMPAPVRIGGEGTTLMGVTLEPYNFAVWWCGWLAGTFTPYGGGWIIAGECANEDALIAALRKRVG